MEQLYIETTLIEHVEYTGEPMVGFLATTVNERFDFPFEIDIKTGNIIEFTSEEIENIQIKIAEKHGYKLVDSKLELYCVKDKSD